MAELAAPANDATQRRCYSCQQTKPLAAFVANRKKKFGRSYRCKACAQAAKSARGSTPEERARRSELERLRRANPATRRKRLASESQYKAHNKNKGRAHQAVYDAIQRGDIQRGPCEVCGAEKAEGHHDDYLKRLDVRWLCPTHHDAWHREHGEGANPHAAHPTDRRGHNHKKTHCPQGHPYAGENLKLDAKGRRCRTCLLAQSARLTEQRRLARQARSA